MAICRRACANSTECTPRHPTDAIGARGIYSRGRYKAILVDADTYLLELTRYVVLNPVRAGMVEYPGQWCWSSYQAMLGKTPAPAWWAAEGVLAQFGTDRHKAIQRYTQFVVEGIGQGSIWKDLNRQVFLGDDNFVLQMQEKAKSLPQDVNIPKAQRRPPAPSLQVIARTHEKP